MALFPKQEKKKESKAPPVEAPKAPEFNLDEMRGNPDFMRYAQERFDEVENAAFVLGRPISATRDPSPEFLEREFQNYNAVTKARTSAVEYVAAKIKADTGSEIGDHRRAKIEEWVERTSIENPEQVVAFVEAFEYSQRLKSQVEFARAEYARHVRAIGGTDDHYETVRAAFEGTGKEHRAILKKHAEDEKLCFLGKIKMVYFSGGVIKIRELLKKELLINDTNLAYTFKAAKQAKEDIAHAAVYEHQAEEAIRGLVHDLEEYRRESLNEYATMVYLQQVNLEREFAVSRSAVPRNFEGVAIRPKTIAAQIATIRGNIDKAQAALDAVPVSDETRLSVRASLESYSAVMRGMVETLLEDCIEHAHGKGVTIEAFRKTIETATEDAQKLGLTKQEAQEKMHAVLERLHIAETHPIRKSVLERTLATVYS